MLNGLVSTKDKTVMEYTTYKNKMSVFDYSKEDDVSGGDEEACYTWNGDPRNTQARCYFEFFESTLNGQDFDTILELPKIFLNIVATGNQEQQQPGKSRRSDDLLLEELNKYTKEIVGKHIQDQLTSDEVRLQTISTSSRLSTISFVFNKIELTMTTLDSIPHLHTTIDRLSFSAQLIGNVSNTYNLTMKNLEISKSPDATNYALALAHAPKPLKKPEKSKLVLSALRKNSIKDIFNVEQTTYNVKGLSPEASVWKAVNNLEVTVLPLDINITPDITQFVGEYFFVREMNKIYKSLDKLGRHHNRLFVEDNEAYFLTKEANIRKVKQEMDLAKTQEKKKSAETQERILPSYYNIFKMNETNMKVSYNTSKLLISLDSMKLSIPTFELRGVFLTRKQLFDKIIKYCIQVATKQVIGHKLLCLRANSEDEDDLRLKEEKNKIKLLFGNAN